MEKVVSKSWDVIGLPNLLNVIQNYETRLEDVRRPIGLTYLLIRRFIGTLILERKSMDGLGQRTL